jgi:hypothetical protein
MIVEELISGIIGKLQDRILIFRADIYKTAIHDGCNPSLKSIQRLLFFKNISNYNGHCKEIRFWSLLRMPNRNRLTQNVVFMGGNVAYFWPWASLNMGNADISAWFLI